MKKPTALIYFIHKSERGYQVYGYNSACEYRWEASAFFPTHFRSPGLAWRKLHEHLNEVCSIRRLAVVEVA